MIHKEEDAISQQSSIEFADAVVDDSFFATGGYKQGLVSSELETRNGLLERIVQFYTDNSLLKRIYEHQLNDLKIYIAQKLFKLDGILCNEETRMAIIHMAVSSSRATTRENALESKYGREMANWLQERLIPSIVDCSSIIRATTKEFSRLKQLDPLCNWYHQAPETSTQVASRIARFAEQMTRRVKWSFLVEPGKFSCHLSDFLGEFHRLTLISQNELAADELAKSAFNANHLAKGRNKLFPCLDFSRVSLNDGIDSRVPRNLVVGALFNTSEQQTDNRDDELYGTSDFIHANYVRGGPLLNTFIITQAPMVETQYDFWRMVYQEKSRFIIMLCGAVDLNSLGPLGQSRLSSLCPYYWPRSEGQLMRFGDITIRNLRVDAAADPVFNITHMEISKKGGEHFLLEHWQFDWQFMGDVHWPFRVLRRARLSSFPTIVHCLDGCGKSGTLVAIETALMHFLRGTPVDDHTVLLSSLFVRMQRAKAVGTPLQYLFIYRCILHNISPYVSTLYQRISLGLTYNSVGFINKYEDLLKSQTYTTLSC